MTPICSRDDITRAERAYFKNGTEDELIDRAGLRLFEYVQENYKQSISIAVVIGGGNNGADGLAFAINAIKAKYNTVVYIVSGNVNQYVSKRMEIFAENGGVIHYVTDCNEIAYADLVLDGIMGTGFKGSLRQSTIDIINHINEMHTEVLAIDIPSGLDADTGIEQGACIRATNTITFISQKLGHLCGVGRNYCGKVSVADIGVKLVGVTAMLTDVDNTIMPKREAISHKGQYGKVYIIGGNSNMIGGAKLAHSSAVSSLRSGAGYAVLCVPSSLAPAYQAHICEEMLYMMSDNDGFIDYNESQLDEICNSADVVVIGMGLGNNENLPQIIAYLAKKDIVLIIDADGLNALSRCNNLLLGHTAQIVLTPHIGEFNRLLGKKWEGDIDSIKDYAKRSKVVLVVKSGTSIITDGNEVYVNTTGTPAMAKAGSGDVLSGIVGGLATRLSPLQSGYYASYYFGLAGERASCERGENSVIASDIVDYISM